MGTIKLGCYTEKSYIKVFYEHCWRCVCSFSTSVSPNHRKITRDILATVDNHNVYEYAMRREGDKLVEQFYGADRYLRVPNIHCRQHTYGMNKSKN